MGFDTQSISSSMNSNTASEQTIAADPSAQASTLDLEKREETALENVAVADVPTCDFTVDPPPDGGLRAWLIVLGGHCVIFNSWGLINSFGVWQSFYEEYLQKPPSAISWIGSLQIFLLFLIGTFSGRALDAGRFRYVFIPGSILQIFCIFMTSLCTEYWQVLLSQGFGVGLSNGLIFCPTLGLVSTYFHRKRAFAIALVACGSATGGIIMPLMVQHLLPKIGFGWTMRCVGFVMTATIITANLLLRPRLPPRRKGQIVDLSAFKELPYTLYAISSILFFFGLYFAFFYLGSYARLVGLSRDTSFNLLIIMNGVSFFGRVIPNFIADKFGCLNLLIPCILGTAIMIFVWTGITTTSGLYGFAIAYGFCSAGIQSLFPASMASLTVDMGKVGVRMGMIFTLVSVTTLTGPPICGALIQADGGRYLHAELFAGVTVMLAAVVLVAARLCKTGMVLKAKA